MENCGTGLRLNKKIRAYLPESIKVFIFRSLFTSKTSVMKYLLFFVLCLVLMPNISFSQKEKGDTILPFLYLNDGTFLEEDEFEVKKGIFGMRFFNSGGDKIDIPNIKFYQSDKEYLAGFGGSFAIRKEAGTLDLYTLSESSTYYNGSRHVRATSSYYLYNRGFEDLKVFNYDNLKSEFSVFPNNNHPQEEKIILGLLEKGKKSRKTNTIVFVSGVSALVVGAVLFGVSTGSDENGGFLAGNPQLGLAGLGLSAAGVVTMFSTSFLPKERKFYLKSFRTYNRVY